jgi:hypothetical protein
MLGYENQRRNFGETSVLGGDIAFSRVTLTAHVLELCMKRRPHLKAGISLLTQRWIRFIDKQKLRAYCEY